MSRDSSKLIRKIILENWEKREVLGRVLASIERGQDVKIRCCDKHGDYSVTGRVLSKWGSRIEMRYDMEHPDGIILQVADKQEIIPYAVIESCQRV